MSRIDHTAHFLFLSQTIKLKSPSPKLWNTTTHTQHKVVSYLVLKLSAWYQQWWRNPSTFNTYCILSRIEYITALYTGFHWSEPSCSCRSDGTNKWQLSQFHKLPLLQQTLEDIKYLPRNIFRDWFGLDFLTSSFWNCDPLFTITLVSLRKQAITNCKRERT